MNQLALLIAVLSLAMAAAAQEQPTFIDPATNLTVNANETACLAKLNWPKCFGWNFRNTTLKEDPDYAKTEAQICTPECKAMKASLSREYVESKCGPNPILPRRIRLDRIELTRIRAQFTCSKDETGRSCSALLTESFEAAKFNASEHTGPDGMGQAPWSAIPKDYACSKCILEDLEVEKQVDEWYAAKMNMTESMGFYNRSEAAMQERAQICKGWKPSGKTGSSTPAIGGVTPGSSAASSITLESSMVLLVTVAMAIVAL
ncbi:hypothetical protein BCR44DRAFT_1428330 [Catenaria anguillulae PL171]|uniref:Secreted protein n=1 Tax=Catenaria anguillulae PL171 TaxID=765915 RepID=A0A1Y2HZ73_9FUNG|nr:hypothetical protein BCR44DRAFT_1428330 [Catenaria anguillulae PL171]